MLRNRLIVGMATVIVVAFTGRAVPQAGQPKFDPPVTLAEMVGLPEDNKRSAEPNAPRIYAKGNDGKVNRSNQPNGYPKFPKSDTKLGPVEEAQFHNAIDIQSRRDKNARPEELPFKAGVYGTVASAKPGEIVLKMASGNHLIYRHNSEASVKIGDHVDPNTVIGKTGKVGTADIHLHIQAVDRTGARLIDPDRAFAEGRKKPPAGTPIVFVPAEWVDPGPRYVSDKKPVVVDGVLKVEASKRIYYDDNAPKAQKKDLLDLTGSVWTQSSNYGKEYPTVFRFQAGGQVAITYPDSPGTGMIKRSDEGTWKRQGETAIMAWDTRMYKFTVHGEMIKVSVRYGDGQWYDSDLKRQ